MALPHDGTNGTESNGRNENKQMNVLEKFRLNPGDTVFCRPLSAKIIGCFTHYVKHRSHYCAGKECNPLIHKSDRIWKGYLPVLIHVEKTRFWKPWCLEVTEHLELDFRHMLKVGQTWELFRLPQGDARKTPVQGKLHADPIPANLPPAFDIVPVIKNLYHVYDLDLTAKNPLPDRVYVGECEAEIPMMLAELEKKPLNWTEDPETVKKFEEARNKGRFSPTERAKSVPGAR